jgi:hypothetical protein
MDSSMQAAILIERLQSASDPSDRRQALQELLVLSRTNPAEVGKHGMQVFSDLLQAGMADSSMSEVRSYPT